jgi:uncharacterized membrane protein YeaQ/YmgE (transglycosylase-associated protein family)
MNSLMDLGGGVGIFGTLLIGAVAGWIAEKVTGSDMGLIKNIIVGIIGAYIGGFAANAAGIQLGEMFQGWFWGNVLVSAVGATILLVVLKVLRGSRA